MEAAVLMKSPPTSTSTSSFRLESWDGTKRLLKNQFVRVAKRCSLFHIQHTGLVRASNRPFLVHVVKGGETLTSISKRYGVSIYAIAVANLDVVDVDLVFEGQCLHIPIISKEALVDLKQTNSYVLGIFQRSLSIQVAPESKKLYSTVLSHCQIQLAKGNNLFPFLVPIIAFCISYVIKVFQHRVYNILQNQALDKGTSPSKSIGSRWRAALYDTAASDAADTESKEEHKIPVDNQSVASIEEMSRAYTELDPAYLKFLSDCGMSKWGYWRGGSAE